MESVADLAGRLAHWLGRLMPAGQRLDDLVSALDFTGRTDPITADACREIEKRAQAHSRHLELHFDAASTAPPDSPDGPAPGWPPVPADEIRARAGGFSAVRRRPDGTAVLTIDSLESYAVARPYLESAFDLAGGSARIVLDLRANGGGDPATLTAIVGRLLGPAARHLSDVVYRDRRRQWWTTPGPALTQDVAVLVSGNTYSSAEALAYHLQARGRVTVVGERTRGAADHITPIRLAPQVLAFVPEAYVVDAATGGNWEQTGVVPDVECTAEDAVNRWP